jgi:hypothetical protein
MSNLETPEDLSVSQSIEEISPEHCGESVVLEFAPTKKATLARIDGVVPIQTSVEPAKPFQPPGCLHAPAKYAGGICSS